MKKLLSAVIALSLCGLMLTACGSKDTAETETLTESITESETTETTTETTTEATTASETEAETETDDSAAPAGTVYASIEEFSKSDVFSLPTEAIAPGDSYIYNFVRVFEGAKKMYFDVESVDGSMSMMMAISADKIAMKMQEPESGSNITILIRDMKMYMIDEASKSGYYSSIDESTLADYDVEALLSEIDIDESIENAADVKVCKVEIGGKEYTFETADTGGGFLFDADGKLCAIISPDTDTDTNALVVNEFSGDAPDEIFELPADCTLVDMEASMNSAE